MTERRDRKAEHLDLCRHEDVAFRGKTTLLEQVELVHDALPEMSLSEVELDTPFLGHTLRAPLMIAAMTGGTAEAETVNRDLARVAEDLGLAFGFGSMRPLLEGRSRAGFFVRDEAPNVPLLGNLGVVQASEVSSDRIQSMLDETGCDALCVHLNPAMEVIQPEGNDDFRGGLDTLARLSSELTTPVIAKETGCGLSRTVVQRLVDAGISCVDVSGAGGTSWVGVEALRADAAQRSTGDVFWDWGIPTAASVLQVSDLAVTTIATGGIGSGLDVARALALGADIAGLARRLLLAHRDAGASGARAAAQGIVRELTVACLLTGHRSPSALRTSPMILGPALRRWLPSGRPDAARFGVC